MTVQLRDWFFGLFGRPARTEEGGVRRRGPATHVVILDGTMSSLEPGYETNAGLTFKLLSEVSRSANMTVHYEAGIQWRDWAGTWGVMTGKGINRQIERAYGVIATRYREGDRIVLIGYSRGAYAIRSLAGVIDRVGLLRAEHATERNIRNIYRHYECTPDSAAARTMAENTCHEAVEVEMIGVWDTVKSLGLNMPVLWRLSAPRHAFHNHHLGKSVKRGFHALARNETRVAYAPVMWDTTDDWDGHLVQMWFRGTHGDVGGHLLGRHASRPLANVPLNWMLEQAVTCGLSLPTDWQTRVPSDASAPSVGTFSGFGKWFITRRNRKIGLDPSERVHPSVAVQVPVRRWTFFGFGKAT